MENRERYYEENHIKQEEKDLVFYLEKYSDRFSVVISVKELAKGGEAIVYHLSHVENIEVVIKKSIAHQKFNGDQLAI